LDISDLNKSISEMSEKELERRIIEIRKNINTKPKRKVNKKTKTAKKSSLKSLLTKMTDEQKINLLNELEQI